MVCDEYLVVIFFFFEFFLFCDFVLMIKLMIFCSGKNVVMIFGDVLIMFMSVMMMWWVV